ncbi:hypothetical protein FH972_022608 [Carpinus fangiana]|uniref:Uncharacterized protein n=1 Tax=Carpinus fangiana TaxID=176857 RepID=A0A5N6KSQ9_9ROSI|nr:hypothetical protein FH972_022608 [Carpinus fangiana]
MAQIVASSTWSQILAVSITAILCWTYPAVDESPAPTPSCTCSCPSHVLATPYPGDFVPMSPVWSEQICHFQDAALHETGQSSTHSLSNQSKHCHCQPAYSSANIKCSRIVYKDGLVDSEACSMVSATPLFCEVPKPASPIRTKDKEYDITAVIVKRNKSGRIGYFTLNQGARYWHEGDRKSCVGIRRWQSGSQQACYCRALLRKEESPRADGDEIPLAPGRPGRQLREGLNGFADARMVGDALRREAAPAGHDEDVEGVDLGDGVLDGDVAGDGDALACLAELRV